MDTPMHAFLEDARNGHVDGPGFDVVGQARQDTGRSAGPDGPGARGAPPKLYRIGEVVSYSGVSRQTIHNYTTMGLLRESCWTPGGHRLYDESVFERLDRIAELKSQNRRLQEIREHFASEDNTGP